MTPTRAAALEAVAIASRFFREAVSAPLCTMPEGYLQRTRATLDDAFTALDTLPAEPEPEGEMVEVWGYVRTDRKGFVDGRVNPDEKYIRDRASAWGATENGPIMGTVFVARIPRPVVPEVVAKVVKP